MNINELVEQQEINIEQLADEIMKAGFQVSEIVKQLIEPD